MQTALRISPSSGFVLVVALLTLMIFLGAAIALLVWRRSQKSVSFHKIVALLGIHTAIFFLLAEIVKEYEDIFLFLGLFVLGAAISFIFLLCSRRFKSRYLDSGFLTFCFLVIQMLMFGFVVAEVFVDLSGPMLVFPSLLSLLVLATYLIPQGALLFLSFAEEKRAKAGILFVVAHIFLFLFFVICSHLYELGHPEVFEPPEIVDLALFIIPSGALFFLSIVRYVGTLKDRAASKKTSLATCVIAGVLVISMVASIFAVFRYKKNQETGIIYWGEIDPKTGLKTALIYPDFCEHEINIMVCG